MSDVYVAFVRDDQSYAEALAVALQGSGFTVSRSASVVEAVDTCGAIVVLWTPAAARSKLFIDAADRAFRAGKMVLARMGGDPLPPMFTGVEAHTLTRWSGDPESPEIDSIVFHVDRLVNRTRLRPGPGQPGPTGPLTGQDGPAEPPPNQRGVVHQFPGGAGTGGAAMRATRPAEAPRAPPQAYPMPTPSDPLAEEAAYWRRIQHSTDPAEFYGYLERYGRNGAFAELAEARMQALAPRPGQRPPRPGTTPPMPQPMPQAMPGPIPQPMQAPPINRGGFSMDPPVGRAAPRNQRVDAPPIRPRPAGAPAGVRDEPASSGGGGVRGLFFLLFLAIIGGGGYYIYTQLQGPEVAAIEDSAEPWTPPQGSPAEPEPTPGELADAGLAVSAPIPARPVRQPPPERAAAKEQAPEPPPPAPVFRTLPPAPAPTPAPVSVGADLQRDVGPAVTAAPIQITPPPTPAPSAQTLPTVRPRWAQRPSERDLRAAYPASAQRANVEGRVVLDCVIGTDLAIRCRARSETPAGYGFAAAALRVAQQFRSAPLLMDGRPAAGERATVSLIFRPE